MTSYKLNFKKFSGGEIIRTYSNNEYGYVIIESDEIIYDSVLTDLHLNFINADTSTLPKREAILRARTELLKKFVDEFNDKDLLGRVTIFECLEDEIPLDIQRLFFRDDVPLEQEISQFVKTLKYSTILNQDVKEEKLILKKNNKRILQFMNYSPVIKGDIIISEYDIDILHNIVDVFSASVKENEEVEIKKYDSLLIRLIKQTKLTQIAESKNKARNIESEKITYQNIANFSIGEPYRLFQFFVEYKEGEDPFGIYLPKRVDFFSGNDILNWLQNIILSDYNNTFIGDILYNKIGIYHSIKNDTYQLVIKTMFSYKESFAKEVNNHELEKKWLELINENNDVILKSQQLNEFANFFNENNYNNFKAFIVDFEKHLSTYNPGVNLYQIIDEILVLELFMKNIGRNHMSVCNILSGDSSIHFVNCSQDNYYYSPLFPENLSLTSHFEYDNLSFGNYNITLNWSWCLNHVINSNIEKEFQNNEYEEVKLCDILRYSQNYINLKKDIKNHYFRDFLHLYEGVVPVVPDYFQFTTQQSVFLSEQNKILGKGSKENKDKLFSPYYSFLSGKFNVSSKYIEYCISLCHQKFFEIANIYESNVLISLPFWEIPRIQTVMFNQYFLAYEAKLHENQLQDYEYYSADDEYLTSFDCFDKKDFVENEFSQNKDYVDYLRDLTNMSNIPDKPDLYDFLDNDLDNDWANDLNYDDF